MSALFYYDLGSPYAYLAAERVEGLLGDDLEWRPVLLGAVFKATGRCSWARTGKRGTRMAEIERRAAQRGLPALSWPEPWPGDGLLAMRAAVVAHRLGSGRDFALHALRVHFRDGRSLNEREALETALLRAGLDPARVARGGGGRAGQDGTAGVD